MSVKGRIVRISGPLVVSEGMQDAQMYEMVMVGEDRLIGEVTRIRGDKAYIQVYESTTGLRPGEPVEGTGAPLSVWLGPGIIGNIYDGVQRPLPIIAQTIAGIAPHRRIFVERGVHVEPIPRGKKWHFTPGMNGSKPGAGGKVEPGDVLGRVQETSLIEHRVMVPPGVRGRLKWVAGEGDYTIEDAIAVVERDGREVEVRMAHRWPVRIPRPYKVKQEPTLPLITGVRIIDTLFPMAKGGTGAVPGGFGTGKCVPPYTPILLSDGRLVEIGDLYGEYSGEGRIVEGGGDEALIDVSHLGLKVVSFDGERLVEKKVTHLYKGRSNLLVRIKLGSGRVLEVTPPHKLLKFEGGRITEAPAITLRRGDKVVVPIRIPLEGRLQPVDFKGVGNAESMSGAEGVRIPRYLDEKLAELLGIIASAGALAEDGVRIRLGDVEAAERAASLLREVFGVEASVDERGVAAVYSKGVAYFLEGLLSSAVFKLLISSPEPVIAAFLKGYSMGASRRVDGRVELVAWSLREARLLGYLLSRLGSTYTVEEGEGYRILLGGLGAPVATLLAGSSGASTAIPASGGSPLTPIPGVEDAAADVVEEVEVLEGDYAVYDVTVEDTHNFVGGDVPSILHNTVTLHSLAQWSDARVVVYIGCGERGNEMTEVLERFPEYKDPWTGRPLMERTILIANTSNMPVAAREASIYVGVTLAEYYRDMGYDVLLVADSTSRWAEALREIAGRLEEMPAEEGYPSYLASRLAEFYERAGRIEALGSPERYGSVTIVGAVSPPGGDFTEPVTSHTKRFIRVFWALDTKLAYSRHYPAINWILSYSAYVDLVTEWWRTNVDPRWREHRDEAMEILMREDELQDIVRLVGTESLSEKDKLILEVARMLKDGFLKQNAYDAIDAFATPQKQFKLLRIYIDFYRRALELVEHGIPVARIRDAVGRLYVDLVKAKFEVPNDKLEALEELRQRLLKVLDEVEATSG